MSNSKGLIIFDTETTGTDRSKDQVIEICVQFGVHDSAQAKVWRLRPNIPISPGAQAVHGIRMEDLIDCPSFSAIAEDLREIIENAHTLVGYNISFDIDILQSEYKRLGQPLLDVSSKYIVDPLRLWQKCEPRTLEMAHRRFAGSTFSEAHTAKADVAATGRVLMGMLKTFGLQEQSWDEIATACSPSEPSWVGPSKHIQWDKEGSLILGFGKHSGRPLGEMAASQDQNYLRWVMTKDFPPHVVDICEKVFEMGPTEFQTWVAQKYGKCPIRIRAN